MKSLLGTFASFSWLAVALAAAVGCEDPAPPADAGFDAGAVAADAGEASFCPRSNTPAPEELMGACCWRFSNAEQLDTPELRLTYIDIAEPEGSNLSSATFRRVLNEAMQNEAFNWLVRASGADADGDITLVTGFGRREADGTYAFSQGAGSGDPANWCPVTIDATIAGETVTSETIDGDITVPVFDETGEMLQVELTLRQIAIDTATLSEDRSCIGEKTALPFAYAPAGVLSGYIEVEPARLLELNVPPIMSTVCAVVAGSLIDPDYCDSPQGEWATPPNALCDDVTGCATNQPGMTDVCDPAVDCNAWRLVAEFAAAGVDITNDLCP